MGPKVWAVVSECSEDITKGLRAHTSHISRLSITYLELSHWTALRNMVHGNSNYFDKATLLTF